MGQWVVSVLGLEPLHLRVTPFRRMRWSQGYLTSRPEQRRSAGQPQADGRSRKGPSQSRADYDRRLPVGCRVHKLVIGSELQRYAYTGACRWWRGYRFIRSWPRLPGRPQAAPKPPKEGARMVPAICSACVESVVAPPLSPPARASVPGSEGHRCRGRSALPWPGSVAAIAFATAANAPVRWWRSLIARDPFRRGRVDGSPPGPRFMGRRADCGHRNLSAAGRRAWTRQMAGDCPLAEQHEETLTRRPLYGDLRLARDDVDGIALGLELMAD